MKEVNSTDSGNSRQKIYKFSKKHVVLVTLIGALVVATIICSAFGCYALGVNFAKTVITLDETKTYQTMQRFGASSAWVYQELGLSQDDNLKNTAMEMLYGDTGLELNTFRYNVGAGGVEVDNYEDKLRGAESYFIADRFNGDYGVFADESNYDFTRDKGVRNMFEKALALGNIDEIVFFANSPHYLMTQNGKTSADQKRQSNLKEECYKAYSDYLLVIVGHLYKNIVCKYNSQIKIRISPVNEPQWDWGGENSTQEGCHYEPKELGKFYDVFYSTLTAFNANNSTEFAMDIFESGNYRFDDRKSKVKSYIEEFAKYDWFDSLDTLSVHSYGTDLNKLSRTRFHNYIKNTYDGLNVSVSEYCVMQGGVDDSMDMGLYSAKVIMRDLNVLNAVGWNYWLSVSKYDYEDGLLYWNGNNDLKSTKRYYAMGHFSKYITYGSVRIDSKYNDSFGINGVECVAFKRVDGSIVLVVLNDSKRDKDIKVKGAYQNICEILTTQSNNWVISQYEYDEYITIPANSIATYIMTAPQSEEE